MEAEREGQFVRYRLNTAVYQEMVRYLMKVLKKGTAMIKQWLGLALAGVGFIASLLNGSRLAPEIATHWNIRGGPDDWSSPTFVVPFMPGMIVAMTVLLNVLPRIDPRGANYARCGNRSSRSRAGR